MKKNILILTYSNLKNDARVRRQIQALHEQYNLLVICPKAESSTFYKLLILKETNLNVYRKVALGVLLLFRFYKLAIKVLYPYSYIMQKVDTKIDLILANDVETLPLAFEFKNKYHCPIVFDAHEYAPRHFENNLTWRLFFQPLNIHICNQYLHQTSAMMTVGWNLAKEYSKHFKVNPIVVTNANVFHDLKPQKISNSIKLVHHGVATPARKLEVMINMMNHLDQRFTLDLYLLSWGYSASKTLNYPKYLTELAAGNHRINILPPIKSEELVFKINNYDIGVFLLPPVNFNYENTLPNKLFDFIQARLGVAIGPSPEMAKIVRDYGLGVVASEFTAESLATELNKLTNEDIYNFKLNSDAAARVLNAEKNISLIQDLISNAFANEIS